MKTWVKFSVIFLFIAWIISTNVQAQSPFVHEGSIGEVTKKPQPEGFGTLEIQDWVGQRFIFLPQTKKIQSYGYQSFDPKLSYDDWVGKIVTVTEVSSDILPKITFKTDDGKLITATAYGETIEDIAPLRDLEYARTNWLGKTLWLRGSELVTYDDATDQYGSVELKRFSPVKVQDVVAGWYNNTPIRFILKTDDGKVGFLDVNVSGTNIASMLRKYDHFTDEFFEVDPRKLYQWPTNVWEAVENRKVFIGMTVEQAKMSWGSPQEINRTTTERGAEEQWIYEDNYIYVSGGKITAVQN